MFEIAITFCMIWHTPVGILPTRCHEIKAFRSAEPIDSGTCLLLSTSAISSFTILHPRHSVRQIYCGKERTIL